MAARAPASRVALATSFIKAAHRYWLDVFPRTRSEGRRWKHHAQRIPDPTLRRHALDAQRIKSGNIEGSTAFAAFAPYQERTAVIRAQVAFQSAYDYLDTLAEQPSVEPALNGRQLHQALVAASDAASPHVDYYAYNTQHDDGGYLAGLVNECRAALTMLPSYLSVALPIQRLTQRIVAYQSLNLSHRQGGQDRLAKWAQCETPKGSGLAWWETAAAAGSSLGIFALITAAARPVLQPD
jgi:tetraprenyl-beta-curcumene synthase